MSTQERLCNISKESRELMHCRNGTPDFFICNSYLEGFKLNKLYIFRIYKS